MRQRIHHSKPATGLAIGTSEHYRWLYGITQSLLVLNLLDGVFTLLWVQLFGAEEANIFLSDLVEGHAVGFMLVKLTLVSLGTVFLWRRRDNPLAVIAIFVAFFSYYEVFLFHLRHSATLLS